MKKLSSSEIRDSFLKFFEEKDHLKIASSSIVPKNDNTLLFINAGMAPLKKYFLGLENPKSPRLCNVQPCIRTKDIDDVGDRHHLTIFEMLGSWSIGDYYKDRAVELAYELLVDRLGFDSKRLYATVYKGNSEINLPPDEVSARAWERAGISGDKIIALGEDNFWTGGDTGPCGPCTEVFYDCGEEFGEAYAGGDFFDTTKRYIEIWNAGVFMEFNRGADGKFSNLPMKSVDTGAGLERLAMIMNGHESVYDTDLLRPILDLSQSLYGVGVKKSRMISDHLRAAVFILSEGVLPGNEGQGYIPRRLIRKVVSSLVSSKVTNLDLNPVVDTIIQSLTNTYPHLGARIDLIKHNVKNEVKDFYPVINKGLEKIDKEVKGVKGEIFPGDMVCDLVTTYGLPFDVIENELNDRGIAIDEEGFEDAMKNHKKISRAIKRSGGDDLTDESLVELIRDLPKTEFLGHEFDKGKCAVVGIISKNQFVDEACEGDEVYIIAKKTPFYGESGGQVGDIGSILGDKLNATVKETIKINDIHIHSIKIKSGEIINKKEYEFIVDKDFRDQTKKNHSATHLLHKALHMTLGEHAVQKGSHVTPDRLRFDFAHTSQVKSEELKKIETIVNDFVGENIKRVTEVMDYKKALKKGAMALFGENYSEKVRVVSFDNNSIELCGGTHVCSTGEIGFFVITSEASVAKGIRRIEAVTGKEAVKYFHNQQDILKRSSEFLKVGPEKLYDQVALLKKRLSEERKKKKDDSNISKSYSIEEGFEVSGIIFKFLRLDEDSKSVKTIGDQLIDKGEMDLLIIASQDEKSLKVFSWASKKISAKIKASDLLKEILNPIGGKGGGKANFAQGGGQKLEDFNILISNFESLKQFISSKV